VLVRQARRDEVRALPSKLTLAIYPSNAPRAGHHVIASAWSTPAEPVVTQISVRSVEQIVWRR